MCATRSPSLVISIEVAEVDAVPLPLVQEGQPSVISLLVAVSDTILYMDAISLEMPDEPKNRVFLFVDRICFGANRVFPRKESLFSEKGEEVQKTEKREGGEAKTDAFIFMSFWGSTK